MLKRFGGGKKTLESKVRFRKKSSNEAALSLRSRRSGTKRTARKGCLLSADVFQGASFGIISLLKLVY